MKYLRLSSVQTRLGITFLAFLALLVISVAATFFGLQVQSQDARIINLAGRQRMLLQQMTSLALGYSQAGPQAGWYAAALRETAAEFEQTLAAMQSGGQIADYTGAALTLPVPPSPALAGSLGALRADWAGQQERINRLLSEPDPTAQARLAHEIEGHSGAIIQKADQVVQSYEQITRQKLDRLRARQAAFLLAGLAILAAGWWITRRSVVLPLGRLAEAARAIGAGALEHPVAVQGPDEVQMLGGALDQMRGQIHDSRSSLQQWAGTLEERVQQRTRELEALALVSQEITAQLDIAAVLDSVARKARELSGADVASLCLLDSRGQALHLHATDGPPETVKRMAAPVDHPVARQVLRAAGPHPCDVHTCDSPCQIMDPQYLASHLAAPLLSRGQVIGALCIGSQRPGAFRPETLPLLNRLAGVTAVALENSRLYQQAEALATLEERQRMAAEIHDGSLQTLNFLRLMARWAEEQIAARDPEKALASIQQIERAGDQMEHEIRRAVASLQDNFSLSYTLQDRLAEMAEDLSRGGVPVEFQSELLVPLVLSRQESEQALRIVQEGVVNAQKHSRSERIVVTLSQAEDRQKITLAVRDFGTGFSSPAPAGPGQNHFGLKIMRARAARLGGELAIRPGPGSGTEVTFSWTPISTGKQPEEE